MNPLTPTVHLNGTSLRELQRGWSELEAALSEAKDKLRRLEFNARDYYPSPRPQAWERAARAMQAHARALESFHTDAAEVTYELEQEAAAREARKGGA